MDIFKWAEENDYIADYYDHNTGYIYHVKEYGNALKFFGIDLPMKVTDINGNVIGHVHKEKNK